MTVGDAVSLLPRDLGPGTSTSAASRALASAVGISWTSELLTVTGVDPDGPVSVQPNSMVTWGTGIPHSATTSRHEPVSVANPEIQVDDLKGSQAQAAKLTEWLKLALDEPHLLKTLGRRAPIWVCWCRARPASARRRWCARCAPAAGWCSSTARKSARWPPKTGSKPWPRR